MCQREPVGSEPAWTAAAKSLTPLRSGDVCLIDHDGEDVAEHIVMVDSYAPDTRQLRTIEGNTLGIRSNGDGLVDRNDEGAIRRDSGNTRVGIHIREMGEEEADREGTRAYQNRAGNTVVGCGRVWSGLGRGL